MSNRIDFFQSAQTKLTLPGAMVSVLFDGALCPELVVMEVVRSGWPEFSWARLAYNPATQQDANWMPAEQVETKFAMGKSICIRQIYNSTPPGAATFSLSIFEGHIEGIETRLDSNGENIEIIAKDFSAALSRITVYGQRITGSDDTTLFLAGMDTIFNADGKANASLCPAEVNGKSYTVFCAEASQSRFFSLAEIIDYLLCEYLPVGCLQTPKIEQLRALTENQSIRDLDVTGLNLLEALHHCCERAGLRFKFAPRLDETGPRQAIIFYKNDTGRVVELDCQQRGKQLSTSITNIATISSKKNFWPVTHKYIGQGDFKVYEATFELVKAWDPADEDTDYEKFSPSTNPDFYKVKDVYRKWSLNEAGDYSNAPYNQGEAFDFIKIFQSNNFVRRRRFWPSLSTDKNRKSLGYFLQVSYDGINWWQYLHAFNNILDECGIWLSSDQLDVDTWIAALKGVLRFRITASVVSDERLICEIADGPVGSAAPVVRHIIMLPRQFKFRKVSGQSIFANDSDGTLGVPDEVDDSAALYEFVRHKAIASSEIIETAKIQTLSLVFDYRVGDRISTSPQSRDLLSCRSDNRSTCRIERVQMDFQKQCTNLKIVRQRNV